MSGPYRMTTSTRSAAALLTCLAALLLAGCGSDSSTQPPDVQPPSGATSNPNRPEIVFARAPFEHSDESDLYLMGADGRDVHPLLQQPGSDASPVWAPDGNSLIFDHWDGTDYGWSIWTVNADGTGARQLPTGPGMAYGGAFSPDGQRISYFRLPDPSDDAEVEIDVMRLDGSDRRAIVSHRKGVRGPTSWSRRDRIAFTIIELAPPTVWAVNLDGSARTKLTAGGTFDDDPAWSPDGARIASSTGVYDGSNWVAYPIRVASADGSGSRMVTAGTSGPDEHPSWSPDGQWILFDHVSSTGNAETVDCSLFKVRSAGGTPVALPTGLGRGSCAGASWR
jgi:Tol biopolymer transport system component